jgi:hypothetical protein
MSINIQVKKNSDMDTVFGNGGQNLLRQIRDILLRGGSNLRTRPRSIALVAAKRPFHLNDGDTLHAVGLELNGLRVTGETYLGSGESAINFWRAQHAEGQSPAAGQAVIFIRTFWDGQKTSWSLEVVSVDIVKMLGAATPGASLA